MERLLAKKAIRHWKEWLPNRYRELVEANQLLTAAEAAAKGAAQEIRELMDAGARLDEAEEVVLPKWILLPPEETDEEAEAEPTPTELEKERAERKAAWDRIRASRNDSLFPKA